MWTYVVLTGLFAVAGRARSPNDPSWVRTVSGYSLKAPKGPTTEGAVEPIFTPSSIQFDAQPLCRPRQQYVTILNKDPDHDLKLYSIASPSDDVQCTWFDKESVPPGQNTSFMVVHLGRGIGRAETRLEISSSHGEFTYDVVTHSVVNPLRARPLTSGRVPIGVEYTQPISVYNPYDEPLRVTEVYTSNPALRLALARASRTGTEDGASDSDSGSSDHGGVLGEEELARMQVDPSAHLGVVGQTMSWVIAPRTSKTVMHLLCHSDVGAVIQGYVHIRTNGSDTDVVIPVRVEAVEAAGLYHGPGDSVDFGAALTVADAVQTRPLVILSNTGQMLRVQGAQVTECTNLFDPTSTCPDIGIRLKRQSGRMMDPNVFTEVGELTLDPRRAKDTGYFQGYVSIAYTVLDEQYQLDIPFSAHILQGSLHFPSLSSAFPIGSAPFTRASRRIEVSNGFGSAIEVVGTTVAPDVKDKVSVGEVARTVLGPAESTYVDVSFLPTSENDVFQSHVEVWTNMSSSPFVAPVHTYKGDLLFSVADSVTSTALDFGTIFLGEEATLTLELSNPNPVPVDVWHYTVNATDVVLDVTGDVVPAPALADVALHGRLLVLAANDSDGVDGKAGSTSRPPVPAGAHNLSVHLPPWHMVTLTVRVLTDTKARMDGDVVLTTSLNNLHVPVSYRAHKHSVLIKPTKLTFQPVLPGRLLQPSQRKTSPVLHLVPMHVQTLTMAPRERLGDITNIYSDDPRLVIEREAYASGGGGGVDDGGANDTVTLARVTLDPTKGPWNELYVPQIDASMTSDLPDLNAKTIAETKRARAAYVRLLATKRTDIKSKIYIDSSNAKSDLVDVHGTLEPLHLGLPPSVSFPLTQVGGSSREDLVFTNPTQHPVLLGIQTLDDYADHPARNALVDLLDWTMDDLDGVTTSAAMFNASLGGGDGTTALVEPYGSVAVSVEFRPTAGGSLSTALLLRNNLTIVEALAISGEAGIGRFGFPKTQPYVVDGGLSFPLTEHNLSYCAFARRMLPEDTTRTFSFNVSVINRGNMPVRVLSMGFGSTSACSLGGFTLENCQPFTLRPMKAKVLTVSYTPDFQTSLPRQTLFVTLQGQARPMKFGMEVVIPRAAARACFFALPGPEWEGKFRATVLVSLLTILGLVVANEWAHGSWEPSRGSSKRRKTKDKSATVATTTAAAADDDTVGPDPVAKEGEDEDASGADHDMVPSPSRGVAPASVDTEPRTVVGASPRPGKSRKSKKSGHREGGGASTAATTNTTDSKTHNNNNNNHNHNDNTNTTLRDRDNTTAQESESRRRVAADNDNGQQSTHVRSGTKHKGDRKDKGTAAKDGRDRSDSVASDSICCSDSLESDRSASSVAGDVDRVHHHHHDNRKNTTPPADNALSKPTDFAATPHLDASSSPTSISSDGISNNGKGGGAGGALHKAASNKSSRSKAKSDTSASTAAAHHASGTSTSVSQAATASAEHTPLSSSASSAQMTRVERPEVLIAEAQARAAATTAAAAAHHARSGNTHSVGGGTVGVNSALPTGAPLPMSSDVQRPLSQQPGLDPSLHASSGMHHTMGNTPSSFASASLDAGQPSTLHGGVGGTNMSTVAGGSGAAAEFDWTALDNVSGGASPLAPVSTAFPPSSLAGTGGSSYIGGGGGGGGVGVGVGVADHRFDHFGTAPSWDHDLPTTAMMGGGGGGLSSAAAGPSSMQPPSPSRLPPPESLRSVPKPPRRTSLIPPLQRQQAHSRRAPPGLFEEAPTYTSLPPISLGSHAESLVHAASSGAPSSGPVDGSGGAGSWSSYAPADPTQSPESAFRGRTPNSVDAFAVDAMPTHSATDATSSFSRFGASSEPAPAAQYGRILDDWGTSSLDGFGASASPPNPPTTGADADPALGGGGKIDSVLPSIPYAGVDSNNIWSAGSVFGELDWATKTNDTMDPDAKEYSPW
eukprot:m.119015 g.119015  ORF g.119015 m.119015 type:complete len:1936 (+) comp11004_c0_seq3:89-5896(+)